MNFLIPISYPRSGSTVIQRVLNTADNIFISGEKLGLINSMYSFVNNMKYMKKDLPKIFDYIDVNDDRNPAFNANNINIDGLIFDLIETIKNRIISPPKEKNTIGWKENFISPYELGEDKATEMLMFVSSVFPNCKFILNIRNPKDTANSTVWKLKEKSYEEIDQWRNWLIKLHKNKILGENNTCLVDHDEWSINNDAIINSFINFNIPINVQKSKLILKEELTHLKEWQI